MSNAKVPLSPKSSKLIAAIVGGILLLIVAFVVILSVLTQATISRSDYQAALDQYVRVERAGDTASKEIGTIADTLGATDEAAYKAAVNDTRESLKQLESEAQKLGASKALKTDEGKEKFNAYNQKLSQYATNATNTVSSIEALRPAFLVCDAMSAVPQRDWQAMAAAAEKCSAALDAAKGNVPSKAFEDYAATVSEQYKKYAVHLKGIAALTDPNGAQRGEYLNYAAQTRVVERNIDEAITALSEENAKANEGASSDKEAAALKEFLTARLAE